MPWTINKPVVVPFDFSEHALLAVRRAIELVTDREHIHVLHVLPFIIPTEPGVVWGTIDDGSRIAHAMDAMVQALPQAEFGRLVLDVRLGDPGQVAADRAEELGAELIVVGSHGRTGFARFVLGSTAERVTRLAHCPVLVVKIPTQDQKASEAVGAATLAPA
jgi:nucleotide-binding universal stress UspA family protein